MARYCSIIIPHFNQFKHLEKCLLSLIAQVVGDEIIVIDNGSNVEELSVIKKIFPQINWVNNTLKQNPYTSRNIGIEIAKHDFLAFLDASCLPHSDWLIQVKKSIDKSVITIGKFNVIPFSKKLQDLCHGILYLLPDRNLANNFGVPVGNLIVQKQLFTTLGCFTDDVNSGNDIIWTEKALLQGYNIYYDDLICVDYPGKPFSRLLTDSKKYARGVAYHRRFRLFSVIKLLLPLKVSTFKYAVYKRKINLSFKNTIKLYLLCYQVKLNYGFEIIKKKCFSRKL